VNALISEVTATMDDVLLREKTGVLMGRIFAFAARLDQNFQILAKIKALVTLIVSKITFVIARVQRDMDKGGDQPRDVNN